MDITPFDWGAKYGSPTFDSGPALQKAINYAANITGPDREGPYCEVNLAGRELMIDTPIILSGMDKVTIANGALTALPGLGTSPIITLGNGTSGGGANYCNLHNIHLECSFASSGVLINGATAQHFSNVRIHGMGAGCYGMRTQFNSGAGVYEKVNIQQRHAGEAGNDLAANRTAIGLDIGRADDIFIGCIVSYCGIPLNLTSGPIQFSACHFFNGGTIDGLNLPIIVKTGTGGVGGNHLFTGCYLDKGVIRITDNFRAIFDGCHIINDDGQQTCIFDLVTTAADETGRGFSVVGCEFIYNTAALSDGVVKYSASGAGSWVVDKKITWNANRHADTVDVPVALAQWQDEGCIDDSGRFIMGRTASQSLTGYHPNIQNIGTTEASGSLATVTAVASVSGSHVSLGKSRGDGKGTYAAILNNDRIGTVDFFADDGVNLDTVGGLIKGRAAANWSASEHSTEVVVSTRTGAGGLVDQLVIGNGVFVPTPSPGDSSTKAASTAFIVAAMPTAVLNADRTGATDCLAAVNAAIAGLPATGGTIEVRSGIYLLSDEVLCSKPVIFRCEGYGDDTSSSGGDPNRLVEFRRSGTGAATPMFRFQSATSANALYGCGIKGAMLNGNNVATIGVHGRSLCESDFDIATWSLVTAGIKLDDGNNILCGFNRVRLHFVFGTGTTPQAAHGVWLTGEINNVGCTQNEIWVKGLYKNGHMVFFQGNCDNNLVYRLHASRIAGGTGYAAYFGNGAVSHARENIIMNHAGPIAYESNTYGNTIVNWTSEVGTLVAI